MALPEDMQIVPVILLKDEVARIDEMVKALSTRRRTRSTFLGTIIREALGFSLPDCSVNRANKSPKEQPSKKAA